MRRERERTQRSRFLMELAGIFCLVSINVERLRFIFLDLSFGIVTFFFLLYILPLCVYLISSEIIYFLLIIYYQLAKTREKIKQFLSSTLLCLNKSVML